MADSDGGASHQELPDEVILDHIIARLPPKRAAQCSLLDRNVRRRISSPDFRVRNAALTSRAATVFHCSARGAYFPKLYSRFCDGVGSQSYVDKFLTVETLIMASCNGILLLCINPRRDDGRRFVFNPSNGTLRRVDFPAGSATRVALAVDLDEDGAAGPPFKVVTADVTTEPDQTVVVFSVFVPRTGRSMAMKSRSKFISRRSFTLAAADYHVRPVYAAADYNVRPVYAAGFVYWLTSDARVTVSFDLTRQQGRVTVGPVMTEPDRKGNMWFGHAGSSVRFVHSLQEGIVVYGYDPLTSKWRVDHKIPNISSPSNNDYKHGLCVHFDGGRLWFVLRKAAEEGYVHIYDLSREKWEMSSWRMGPWSGWDLHFFSTTPTTTKVSNTRVDDLEPWEYAKKGTKEVLDAYFEYVKRKKMEKEEIKLVRRRRSKVTESEKRKEEMVKEFEKMAENKAVLLQLQQLLQAN